MRNTKVALAVILGVIFLVIGYVYATRTASELPTFLPGYMTPYSAGQLHAVTGLAVHHYKHALAAFIVGAALLIYAWFVSASNDNETGSN